MISQGRRDLPVILLVILVLSCQQKENSGSKAAFTSVEDLNVQDLDSIGEDLHVTDSQTLDTLTTKSSYEVVRDTVDTPPILVDSVHRDMIGLVANGLFTEEDTLLSWMGFYQSDTGYYMRPANNVYAVAEADPSWGDVTYFETIGPSSGALFYLSIDSAFKGFKIIELLDFRNKVLSTDGELQFSFLNKKYSLKAIKTASKDDLQDGFSIAFKSIVNGKKLQQEIVVDSRSDSQWVEIQFVGDFDTDGNPDVILQVPSDSNQTQYLLYLSTKAKDGQLLGKAIEKRNALGC